MKSDCNYGRVDLIATWVKGHLCSTPDMHMDMDFLLYVHDLQISAHTLEA